MDGKYIQELFDQVVDLSRCYTLWWYFVSKPNAERYAQVERNYPDFFITIADSLRQSFFVSAYRLFDKRPDVKSLVRLVDDLKTVNPQSKNLRSRIEREAAIIQKATRLRHKVFGHRDKAQRPQNVFSAVQIKPKEMERIVRLAQEIVVSVASVKTPKAHLDDELRSHEDAVRSDAHNLMQVLVRYSDI